MSGENRFGILNNYANKNQKYILIAVMGCTWGYNLDFKDGDGYPEEGILKPGLE